MVQFVGDGRPVIGYGKAVWLQPNLTFEDPRGRPGHHHRLAFARPADAQ